MILKELLASTPVFEIRGSGQRKIEGLAIDLEDIRQNYLYIYIQNRDDMSYEDIIKKAIDLGATAICVGKEDKILDYDTTFIRTYNIKRFLSAVTKNFYRNPSQGINMTGITGSHGKTTIGIMIRSILKAADVPTVMINKTSCQLGDEPPYADEDSLNPMVFTKFLRRALDMGIERGILECSYTTIIDERLRHIWFDSLIYTDLYTYFQNKERDYHYLEIRKTLIDHLKHIKCPIIVNMDDYHAQQLENRHIVGYGVYGRQTITAEDIVLMPDSSKFTIHTPRGSANITLGLAGLHNVYNAMAAIGWCVAEDVDFVHIKEGLEHLGDLDHLQEDVGITGNISIQTHRFSSASELPALIENLSESGDFNNRGIILSVPSCDDPTIYADIGHALDEFGCYCILTSDYEDRFSYGDGARNIARDMKNSTVHYEIDRYKALKKARSFTKDGGSITIMAQEN